MINPKLARANACAKFWTQLVAPCTVYYYNYCTLYNRVMYQSLLCKLAYYSYSKGKMGAYLVLQHLTLTVV